MGEQASRALVAAHVATVHADEQLRRLVATLAGRAAQANLSIALLKFAALQSVGVLTPGTRRAADVDVLATVDGAGALASALRDAGFREQAHRPPEQHLVGLVAPDGGLVEIHHSLLGVRVAPEGRSARLDALRAANALRPTTLPGDCFVPCPTLLVAHAIAHGLVQHEPYAYSPFRMMSDLIDLGLGRDGMSATAAADWVDGSVSDETLDALDSLCDALRQGQVEWQGLAAQDSAPARLLRHCVAGTLDERYRNRLYLAAALRATRPRVLWHALVPTDAEIDLIYGPPATRAGYAWRRLLRPFDFVVRLLRFLLRLGWAGIGRR